MPIAAVHELITNRVRVKVTTMVTVSIPAPVVKCVQLQRQREAISIHKQCISWCKVEKQMCSITYDMGTFAHTVTCSEYTLMHIKHIINMHLWL